MSKILGTKHKKIAIVGTAPSSSVLAPYKDPDWEIWGCSAGLFGVAARTNAWFELHRFYPADPGRNGAAGTVPHFSAEYTAFLEGYGQRFKGPVFMADPIERIPAARRYPFEEMIERFGNYHWSSTIAWMLALAIAQEPDEIGVWGVDMAAEEEYARQRPDCQHFLFMAQEMGIKITIPRESDLMRPMFRYGLDEVSPMGIKLKERENELNARISQCAQTIQQQTEEMLFLRGALDDLQYMKKFWVNQPEREMPKLHIVDVGLRDVDHGIAPFLKGKHGTE